MTSDLDVYRSATVLIREHGTGAALEAAQRADAMLERGDMGGYAVWKRIVAAVEEIERTERREGEASQRAKRATSSGPSGGKGILTGVRPRSRLQQAAWKYSKSRRRRTKCLGQSASA